MVVRSDPLISVLRIFSISFCLLSKGFPISNWYPLQLRLNLQDVFLDPFDSSIHNINSSPVLAQPLLLISHYRSSLLQTFKKSITALFRGFATSPHRPTQRSAAHLIMSCLIRMVNVMLAFGPMSKKYNLLFSIFRLCLLASSKHHQSDPQRTQVPVSHNSDSSCTSQPQGLSCQYVGKKPSIIFVNSHIFQWAYHLLPHR